MSRKLFFQTGRSLRSGSAFREAARAAVFPANRARTAIARRVGARGAAHGSARVARMEPTHFLCLAPPPRPTFVIDMTPAEREIMLRHAAWLKGLLDSGKLLLAGPCVDGAYGVAIFKVTDAEEMRKLI